MASDPSSNHPQVYNIIKRGKKQFDTTEAWRDTPSSLFGIWFFQKNQHLTNKTLRTAMIGKKRTGGLCRSETYDDRREDSFVFDSSVFGRQREAGGKSHPYCLCPRVLFILEPRGTLECPRERRPHLDRDRRKKAPLCCTRRVRSSFRCNEIIPSKEFTKWQQTRKEEMFFFFKFTFTPRLDWHLNILL